MKSTFFKASIVMSVAFAIAACGESGTEVDTDADGLTDELESALETDPGNPDSDADFVSDGREYENHTNPFAGDSDADGVWDGDEDEDHNGIFERHERHRRLHRFADHRPGAGFGFGHGDPRDFDAGFGDAAAPWGPFELPSGHAEHDCDGGIPGADGQWPTGSGAPSSGAEWSGDSEGAPVQADEGPTGGEPRGGGWPQGADFDAGAF